MSSAAMAAMPAEKTGIASGVLAMDRVLAGAVGLALTGAIFHSLLGPDSFPVALGRSNWVLVGTARRRDRADLAVRAFRAGDAG